MKTNYNSIFLIALFVVISPLCRLTTLKAQVSIAPASLFIHEQNGVANLYVNNKSSVAQEIQVSFAFGYPDSDSLGNLVMVYDDSLSAQSCSLDPYIRAFPRSFVLLPNQQQTVRIQIRPTADLQEGMYYTRIKILSSPEAPLLSSANEDAINARIFFKFEQVTAVFYKQGNVNTGLEIQNIKYDQHENELVLMPVLKRLGNAPYIGTMSAILYDTSGRKISENKCTTTAYFTTIRRIALEHEKLKPGKYKVELKFDTHRPDMSDSDLVQASQIMYTDWIEISSTHDN